MIMWFTMRARRGVVALTLATGLSLGVVGCSSDGDGDDKSNASVPTPKEEGPDPSTQEGQSAEPLAELKGPSGLLLKITAAQRDSGGFLTVSGDLTNDASKVSVVPAQVSGNETEIIKNGRSLGGATLVDSKGKKRYYVLRDTDGRPLTTTNFPNLKPGDSVPVFMQFPAPPPETTELTFQLPMFSAGVIEITG
ncbi:hypothetical protein [Streptomyces sp. NPDC058632]|uniref:hypothetical protein n=1 Tax=Streptomyces sp. NPDC058632 TaxID=3346567 RepID=UPI00366615C9